MSRQDLFKRLRLPKDVIQLAVRWYCRYPLSYHDVRDLPVDAVTIYRWVQKFGPAMPCRAGDKTHSYAKVIEEMNLENGPDDRIRYVDQKHLNNRIEADHAALKQILRPNGAFEGSQLPRTH